MAQANFNIRGWQGRWRYTASTALFFCAARFATPPAHPALIEWNSGGPAVRKLIAFDDDTFARLKQLARDRMATIQELADEAFTDLLGKHGIPVDLKDALRKSARLSKQPGKPGRS